MTPPPDALPVSTLVAVIGGAALGGVFVWFVLTRRRNATFTLGAGLVIVAAIYVGFATAAGAALRWILLEAVGLFAFGAIAALGERRSAWWLVAGWALHALWDAPLHTGAGTATYTPTGYPAVCFGFDLVVAAGAAYLALRCRVRQTPPARLG